MSKPTDEELAALRRRAAQGWPTSHDLTDALEWLDAERAESARLLEMLNRANAGEAQQIIRAEAAEASLADIKRAIENSELLGAVVDFGNLFEDVALEQWRWTLHSRLEAAQRWAAWFAAEAGYRKRVAEVLITGTEAEARELEFTKARLRAVRAPLEALASYCLPWTDNAHARLVEALRALDGEVQ